VSLCTDYAIPAAYKSPGIDQILAEIIQMESEVLWGNS
jgi:hypothetical protein